MNLDVANTFFAGLSALSALVELHVSYKGTGRSVSAEEAERTLNTAMHNAQSSTAEAAVVEIIDEEMLELLKGKIKGAADSLSGSIRDGKPNHVIDFEKDQADHQICNALKTIKRFNNGVFPDPEYYKLWRRHRCEGVV